VAGPSRHSLDSTMEPENRKAEFEDAKAKAAEFLAKGDPQAAIDQCVQSPYLHRAPPTEPRSDDEMTPNSPTPPINADTAMP